MRQWIICCRKEDREEARKIKNQIKKPGKTEDENKVLYCLGWFFLLFASIAAVLLKALDLPREVVVPPCLFRMLTGYYCPGCGGTRAVRALFMGDFAASFCYHPFVLYGTILFGWFMISNTVEYLSGGKIRVGMKYKNRYVILGALVILLNWIIQNILIFLDRTPFF